MSSNYRGTSFPYLGIEIHTGRGHFGLLNYFKEETRSKVPSDFTIKPMSCYISSWNSNDL